MGERWNPYWDEVKGYIGVDRLMGQTAVLPPHPDHPDDSDGFWSSLASTELRRQLVPRYAWTVTSPDTVAFVAKYAGPFVVDPMAGTGYWARLLAERGAFVMAYDRHAADPAANHWHQSMPHWTRVLSGEAADTVAAAGAGVTLLLSWPPYDTPDGADAVRAYTGNRIIYIGEGDGGCTGDDELHKILSAEWIEVEYHKPVQWWGLHDMVFVYDRRNGELWPTG